MATKISLDEISTAAGETLSRKKSGAEPTTGSSADQIKWDTLRVKACRLFLSDPDARVYLYYLASNAMAAELRTFHALVCEAIVLAESSFSTKEASSSESKELSAKKASLSTAVANVRFDSGDIAAVKGIAADYLNDLVRSSSRNKKIEKGGSTASLSSIATEAGLRGEAAAGLAAQMEVVPSNLQGMLGPGAVAPILPNLAASLRDSSLAPKEELLKIATAVGAYEAFSAPASILFQVHTGAKFPYGLVPSVNGSVLTLKTDSGKAVDPATLMVGVGHIVEAGTTSTEIVSISGTEMTLSSEIHEAGLIIRTPSQRELLSFLSSTVRDISPRLLSSPSSVLRKVAFHKLSRPEAYRIVDALSRAAIPIASLTTEASRSAQVLGVEVSATSDILSAVQSFSPPTSSSSERAVMEVLDAIKSDGLDVIEKGLLSANIPVLGTLSVNDARLSSKTAFQVGQIMEIINPELKV